MKWAKFTEGLRTSKLLFIFIILDKYKGAVDSIVRLREVSLKHMKINTLLAFRLGSFSLSTTNIMSVVERSGRNLRCSFGNSPLVS